MLTESLKYFSSYFVCPRHIRKLGLLKELIAIEARANRCSEDWASHLGNTQKFILENIQPGNKLLVLGSGLLNDLPVEELSEKFQEIILVDIFHFSGTQNKFKHLKNLNFIALDITNTLMDAYNYIEQSEKYLSLEGMGAREAFRLGEFKKFSSLKPSYALDDTEISAVISLNLLSQLANTVRESMENFTEKFNLENEENAQILEAYYQSLILNHIEYLNEFSDAQKILITDTKRMVYDKANKLQEEMNSLEGLDLETLVSVKKQAKWNWHLAPYGEIDYRYRMDLEVGAYSIN